MAASGKNTLSIESQWKPVSRSMAFSRFGARYTEPMSEASDFRKLDSSESEVRIRMFFGEDDFLFNSSNLGN